ncbi:MAG: reverse transcriptase domain-containing protein, partial [Pseudomonadota bacterium]|nr:reverse transcriptase domain-containing protein [Pseudomonadota bacterium]
MEGREMVARLENRFGRKSSTRGNKAKVNLVRYADDFIITGVSKKLLETEVRPLVEDFLHERGLELSQDKTRVVHIAEGFDFLGWNFRKYDGKLLIKPSRKNVKAFLETIRGIVKGNKTVRQANLIAQLNPVIRGWANYHRGAVAKDTFAKVDHVIWQLLWKWACRRHPNKGKQWIKDRYFRQIGSRSWVFAAQTGKVKIEGQTETRVLARAGDTPIQRHVKIKAEANPYDPQWETCFEDRLGLKMKESHNGRGRLFRLWWSQGKRCPVCGERITKISGWHVHHITPRHEGDKDIPSN